MLIISILFLSISGYNYFKDIVEGGMFGTSFFSKTFYFNITSLGFAFLLPYANYSKSITPKSSWKNTVTIISLISYSMYLIHYSFILVFLRKIFTGNSSVIIAISIFILYFLITIFFSILLYNFYEKPMTDLRDFETNKKGLLFVKEYLKKAFKTLKVAFN
jgi:peptidoglycan/LPS O-acetylase OafA/YrhL